MCALLLHSEFLIGYSEIKSLIGRDESRPYKKAYQIHVSVGSGEILYVLSRGAELPDAVLKFLFGNRFLDVTGGNKVLAVLEDGFVRESCHKNNRDPSSSFYYFTGI